MHNIFSDEIRHRRGLFQGSSLSPGLFNFFIDSLLVQLNQCEGGAKLSLDILITNLFFADDGVLIATSVENSQALLNNCSIWSISHGIQFAPKKCGSIIKNIRLPICLYLYDEPLEILEHYRYLGIIVDKAGINWRKSMNFRIDSARKKINWLCRSGMNIFKWRLNSCISLYKSFIRPTLEYGLALQLIPLDILQDMEEVQLFALRRIFCCPSNVSKTLLQVIPAVESMKFRNIRLNARYLEWK